MTLSADGEVRRQIEQGLPRATPVRFLSDTPDWRGSEVGALLVGNLRRELPQLRPEDLPSLEFVQQLYTGIDDFPFDRIPRSAQVAGNVGAYAQFVAEHAVALLLACARLIVQGQEQTLAGLLRPSRPLTYLGGATAVVVGFGEIGREVAVRLHGLGLTVVGVSRDGAPRDGADRMIPLRRLSDELPGALAVVNCLPLTRATQNAIAAREFEAMRADAIYVNVGRAGTNDPSALEAKLRNSPTFRAGLDVWWGEDFEHGTIHHPFDVAAYPNLLGSPHRAGVVPAARSAVLTRAVENVARFFRGEAPRYVADREEYEEFAEPQLEDVPPVRRG